MANNVFANGRELSCKSGSGKSIAAFPDVCMTPPENPATPPGVPVPYPNTGMTGDCTSGSTTVKITKKEVMLKNKSYFKKSTGDEAGAAAKKGVASSVNRGKVYFTMWSMDVKIEGENAVRHLDMTTHNHGSSMNTPPFPFIDDATIEKYGKDPCEKDKKAIEKACSNEDGSSKDKGEQCSSAGLGERPELAGMTGSSDGRLGSTYTLGDDGYPAFLPQGTLQEGQRNDSTAQIMAYEKAQANDCLAARRCQLAPYDEKDPAASCCPGQTPHHLVDDAFGQTAGAEHASAPCICAEGNSNTKGSHGIMHAKTKQYLIDNDYDSAKKNKFKYKDLRNQATSSVAEVFPKSACSEECLTAQLDSYYSKKNITDDTEMTVSIQSGRGDDQRSAQLAWVADRAAHMARG